MPVVVVLNKVINSNSIIYPSIAVALCFLACQSLYSDFSFDFNWMLQWPWSKKNKLTSRAFGILFTTIKWSGIKFSRICSCDVWTEEWSFWKNLYALSCVLINSCDKLSNRTTQRPFFKKLEWENFDQLWSSIVHVSYSGCEKALFLWSN